MENPLSNFLSRSKSCFRNFVFASAYSFSNTRLSTICVVIAAVLAVSSAQGQVSGVFWTGSADTDWNNPSNWSGSAVPTSNSKVVVQSAAPFSPVLRSGITINNLELQAGKTLDFSGTSLTITGVVLGAGTFSVSPSSSLTIGGTAGGSAGTITFSSWANTIGTISLNRTGMGAALTLGSPLMVSNVFNVIAGTYNTGDQLTLKSDVNGSARVGVSTGIISGKVVVEKYIPARRAWRLLCASVAATAAPNINTAWQEGALSSADNLMPGYGTHITGGPSAKGFDQSPTNSSSLKYMYNNTWNDMANTNATLVTRYAGYFFFLRGNRSYNITSTLPTTSPLPTVLRTKGNLNQGPLPAVSVAAAGLTLVANPYASPVSFSSVAAAGTNLKNRMYMWDPTLGGTTGVGGYVVLDWNGEGYTAVPASDIGTFIPAGEAFFVESANGTTTGKVLFNESQKVASSAVEPSGRTAGSETMLAINLKIFNEDKTTATTDGVMGLFNNDYSNDVDKNDATKFNNLSDNLAILSKGKQLAIERRRLPGEVDTLTLNISTLRRSEYQLEFIPKNFVTTGMIVSLYDKFTNSLTDLSSTDTSHYNFSVSANLLSQYAGRFSIVYHIAPVTISAPTAVLNDESSINLEWEIMNAQNVNRCEVEKLDVSGTFKNIGTIVGVVPGARNVSAYHFTDLRAANGYNIYRIKITCFSGQVFYSETVKLTVKNSKPLLEPEVKMPSATISSYTPRVGKHLLGKAITTQGNTGIAVFPNPVQGRTVTLRLGQLNKGQYNVEMFNEAGQTVHSSRFNYQGSSIQAINLNKALPFGIYKLLVKQGLKTYETNVMVNN